MPSIGGTGDAMPKIEIEWKLNPATLLTFAVAAVSIIAGFTQARADINDARARSLTNQERLDRLTEIEHAQQVNQAETNQILKDYGRRIERLEDKK